jgi:hypothetical protein
MASISDSLCAKSYRTPQNEALSVCARVQSAKCNTHIIVHSAGIRVGTLWVRSPQTSVIPFPIFYRAQGGGKESRAGRQRFHRTAFR